MIEPLYGGKSAIELLAGARTGCPIRRTGCETFRQFVP